MLFAIGLIDRFKGQAILSLSLSVLVSLVCLLHIEETSFSETTSSKITHGFSTPQIPFVANIGQMDEQILFYTHTFRGTVYIDSSGKLIYALPRLDKGAEISTLTFEEELINAEIGAITGDRRSPVQVNHFKGNDKSRWKSEIPAYECLDFGKVYSGIEVKLKASEQNIEKLFYVHPHADPKEIKVRVWIDGNLRVDEDGALVVETGCGQVAFTKPSAFQIVDGLRQYVASEYWTDGNIYGFEIGEYDKSKTLIIDPLLASTYLGSVNEDEGNSIAIDENGYVFICGTTSSANFPSVSGSYDTSHNGAEDVFVSKFSPDLKTLISTTFIGGNSTDRGLHLDINDDGRIYVMGSTGSSDFPSTSDAYDDSFNGAFDVFVARFNNDLSQLQVSTFVGSPGYENEYYGDFEFDSDNNVCFVTTTDSSSYPTTSGSYDTTYNGGDRDYVVSILNSDLSELIASTYVGGNGSERTPTIAKDSNGNVFITGTSSSRDFPTTTGAFNQNLDDDYATVVSKLNSSLSDLVASTVVGPGSGTKCIAIDREDNVFIAGHSSPDWPTTEIGWDRSADNEDGVDGYVTKLNNGLSRVIATTFFSAERSGFGLPQDLLTDANGNIYVAGYALAGFPTTQNAYDTTFNGGFNDVFISVFDSDLEQLLGSTFIGGSANDACFAIAMNSSGTILGTGISISGNFPTTKSSFDKSYNGSGDRDVIVFNITGMLTAKGPDLVNKATKVKPKKLIHGKEVTLICKITNKSDFASSTTDVTFYLSGTKKAGKDAITIGTTDLQSINGGKRATVKYKTTLPAGIPSGGYYLLSVIDSENSTFDPKRKNNISTSKKKVKVY